MDTSDKTISNNNSSSLSLFLCEKRFQNIVEKTNISSDSSSYSDSSRDSKNIFEFSFKNEYEEKNSNKVLNYNLNKIEYENIKTTFNKTVSKKIILKEFDEILNNFKDAFSTENKFLLISCLDALNNLSIKYEFLYVIDLTAKWLKIIENYFTFNDTYISNNIIKEIMEIMFSELSKKQINNEVHSKNAQKKYISNQKKIKSLTQDLFYNGNYCKNTIDDLINELEKNDEDFLFNKNKRKVSRKNLDFNKFSSNKSLKEIDSYEYPFKDESYFCEIF